MTREKSMLIQGGTVVTAQGEEAMDVWIRNGMIARLIDRDSPRYALPEVASADEVIDAKGLLILPGLIDCHVHFREPGMEHKATMRTEAASARAGGVTTACEMPNTIPPTVTIAALADKVRRAAEIDDCDIRFFFGVTEEAHLQALRELWTGTSDELVRLKKRCCGVKLYLDHSTGNQKVKEELVGEVFRWGASLGFPIVCHCEDPRLNEERREKYRQKGLDSTSDDVSAHSLLRPPESEERSVAYAIAQARKTKASLHIAHLSTKGGLHLVRQAKRDTLPVTCEVAPHHLFLTTEDYETLGTLAKMNPPLRSRIHQEALWAGIADGTVDCIATDHAPHTLEEKSEKEWTRAPSGVPGVETMVPLLLSVAGEQWPHPGEGTKYQVARAKLSYADVVRLCFENPNRIFGLGKKGIMEGAPADLVLADPRAQWTVNAADLHSKCGWTPYEGWAVKGKVERVLR